MLISFEGIDFCGKSTQIKLLQEYLVKQNKIVKLIREPGGTKLSEKIRDILLDKKNNEMIFETELLLYSASRAQLVKEVILPELENGHYVLSDRFHDSSIAYQGFGRGINIDTLMTIQKFAIGKAMPALTFFLDISLEEMAKRKEIYGTGNLDRIEISGNDFFDKVINGYHHLCETEERFVLIDGTKNIEQIHDLIVKEVVRKSNQ